MLCQLVENVRKDCSCDKDLGGVIHSFVKQVFESDVTGYRNFYSTYAPAALNPVAQLTSSISVSINAASNTSPISFNMNVISPDFLPCADQSMPGPTAATAA